MVPIERVTEIEVIRQYALLLEHEVRELSRKIDRLEQANTEDRQDWLMNEMRDKLSRLQKKFFGFGREKLPGDDKARPVGHPKQQLLIHGGRVVPEDEKRATAAASESPSAKAPEHHHEMSREELEAEAATRGIDVKRAGATAWRKLPGLYQESYEITVVERVYTKVVHKQAKYKLKPEFNKSDKDVIITAPGPVKLNPGCQYSVDFALSVVSDKYEFHLPLERQRRKMEQAGLDVDVKTLYGLCQQVATHCEGEVMEGIRADIRNEFCAVHMDETPWKILGDDDHGYMWVMSNRAGCYYQFEPTRSGKVSLEMVKGYQGAVVTDAYVGYNRIHRTPGIRPGYCWAHLRREFYERYDDFPNEVAEACELIDKVFEFEREAKTLGDLRRLRETESPAIVEKFRDWCLETRRRFLDSEGISKAINYFLGHYAEFTLFLRDLSVPLTNNDAERALRHAVVGRKNFAGSKTINGADTAATLYTVIESCKRCSLKPSEYFKYVITERWHKRTPMTPLKYALEKFKPKPQSWPSKDEWAIGPAAQGRA